MGDLYNTSLFVGSILLLFSIILSKSSNKFGLPILVVFLFIGMVAGSEGLGGIEYEDYELTHSLSLIAICLIIFTGGIETHIKDIKPIFRSGVVLSSFGVLLTSFLIGAFCYFLFDIAIYESLLIGAILSSTDAAAVFTAFRDKNSQVKKRLKSVLEFESGSNDPMAYLLVIIFLGFYQQQIELGWNLLFIAISNPLIGYVGGFFFFKIFEFVNDSIELDFQGLYPALTIAFLFLTFSTVTALDGNGFLAVYTLGIKLGNKRIVHKKLLMSFFDGMSWLFQIGLFILLGLLVFPSRLLDVAPTGVVLSLFLIFIARPLTIFISLAFSQFTRKEKIFISWAGLKGASPIVFASLVATQLGSNANIIFDLVFFAVLISALLQGSTLRYVAKRLGLFYEAIIDPEFPIDIEVIEKTKNGIRELSIEANDFAVEKRIVDLNLPKGSIILFIKRQGSFIIPDGSSTFKEGDKALLVTSEKADLEQSILCFSTERISE